MPKVGNPLSSKLDVELTLPQMGEGTAEFHGWLETLMLSLKLFFPAFHNGARPAEKSARSLALRAITVNLLAFRSSTGRK
jgi:hypothetical protein